LGGSTASTTRGRDDDDRDTGLDGCGLDDGCSTTRFSTATIWSRRWCGLDGMASTAYTAGLDGLYCSL
jgi:hypothetical protein